MNHVNEIKLVGTVSVKPRLFTGPIVRKIMFPLVTKTTVIMPNLKKSENTAFHQIEMLMDYSAPIPTIGDLVEISGHMKNISYPDKNTGQMIYKYSVRATKLTILSDLKTG